MNTSTKTYTHEQRDSFSEKLLKNKVGINFPLTNTPFLFFIIYLYINTKDPRNLRVITNNPRS